MKKIPRLPAVAVNERLAQASSTVRLGGGGAVFDLRGPQQADFPQGVVTGRRGSWCLGDRHRGGQPLL